MASVLLIDDSETHRAEIRESVESSGLFDRVLEAADGLRGLKLLLAESVDMVLCDLEMPGLDGEKLLGVKRATPALVGVPFLFLTASADVERRARLLEDGACDAIAKPFHPAELLARIRLHLKVKQLQDELREKNASLARLSTVDVLTGLRTRRYVHDLGSDPAAANVAGAVIAMAHSLGLQAVAEGVDAEEQAVILRERDCDEMQGFLFSGAVPAEEFVRFLRRASDSEDG